MFNSFLPRLTPTTSGRNTSGLLHRVSCHYIGSPPNASVLCSGASMRATLTLRLSRLTTTSSSSLAVQLSLLNSAPTASRCAIKSQNDRASFVPPKSAGAACSGAFSRPSLIPRLVLSTLPSQRPVSRTRFFFASLERILVHSLSLCKTRRFPSGPCPQAIAGPANGLRALYVIQHSLYRPYLRPRAIHTHHHHHQARKKPIGERYCTCNFALHARALGYVSQIWSRAAAEDDIRFFQEARPERSVCLWSEISNEQAVW